MTQNFRPGVIERIGLDYETVKKINPKIVYGSVSGYGNEGPWKDLPGQDLLAQSRSGLTWLNGNGDQAPTPMGLAAADMLAGHYLVEGILATAEVKNGNGRYYSKGLWDREMDKYSELIEQRRSMGELDHPESSVVMLMHIYQHLTEYTKLKIIISQ